MIDDEVSPLEKFIPRGPAPELRERVLNAVAQELSKQTVLSVRRVPSWDLRIGGLVAAAVVMGILLNLWAVRTTEHQLAELAGPRPVPRQVSDVVEIVESVTGQGTGTWVQQRLVKAWRSRPAPILHRMPDWEQLIHDLENNRDWERDVETNRRAEPREKIQPENIQEVPHPRPDRARLDRRSPVDHKFDLPLLQRQTA